LPERKVMAKPLRRKSQSLKEEPNNLLSTDLQVSDLQALYHLLSEPNKTKELPKTLPKTMAQMALMVRKMITIGLTT